MEWKIKELSEIKNFSKLEVQLRRESWATDGDVFTEFLAGKQHSIQNTQKSLRLKQYQETHSWNWVNILSRHSRKDNVQMVNNHRKQQQLLSSEITDESNWLKPCLVSVPTNSKYWHHQTCLWYLEMISFVDSRKAEEHDSFLTFYGVHQLIIHSHSLMRVLKYFSKKNICPHRNQHPNKNISFTH